MIKSSAIILHDKKLLVVKKAKNPSHYILPGGKLEPKETPIQALQRELAEEINFVDHGHQYILLETFNIKAQFEDEELTTYLFYVTGPITSQITVNHEISDYTWIDVNDNTRTDLASGVVTHAIPQAKKILAAISEHFS